ncbi:hypothetical protein [Cellulomonas sp. SLBN-39]|uniref:hypothetical protein n=1 Tax=Cellulomonas sp. SLBN-39 TaxID=2768446 RepID=UPI00114DB09F|nr:hypothetical protein [Cellulomonas sp. SLBN-39]TQL04528.1 hypothetical protein FBY24_3649 [Cellulomonas sp. SLBN-39]
MDDIGDAAATLASLDADRAHLRARVTPRLSRVYAVAYACVVALLPTALAFLGAGWGVAYAATLLVYVAALAALVSTTRRRLGFWPTQTTRNATAVVGATVVYLGGTGAAFLATRELGSWWAAGAAVLTVAVVGGTLSRHLDRRWATS